MPSCQIEHVASDSDVGTPCGNRAIAECADWQGRDLFPLSHLVLRAVILWIMR
jgi:hypothetical protein